MKFGKKIILINSVIIALLASFIVAAASVAGATVLRSSIHNSLIDTVTSRAAIISAGDGVVPDNFDYDVGGVYLSVYLSDGTLKNGSFPGPIDLPIEKGVISTVRIEGARYYVYDFAVSLAGRDDIYLRGIAAAGTSGWFAAMVSFTVLAGVLAAAGIVFDFLSVRRAVRPIDRMRREVQEITESKDISRRLSPVSKDSELAQLADDYNYMLDSLEGLLRNHERFTSDVAHELRTPLTVILEESEYALNDTKSTEEKDGSLAVICRQAGRLKAITDSLLEFTRLSNRLSLTLSPIDLTAVTEELLADYPFPAGTVCTRQLDEVTAAADVTLYERVLLNLVDNAVKYGKEGGKIMVTLRKEGERAVLTVSDDGIGMSEEALSHAFDRFYREDSARSRGGLGLGLSFVKEIVRLFGGTVDITSAPQRGTEVKVSLLCASPATP